MNSFFKNIFRFGWANFYRNKLLSFQVIFVMVVVVLTVTSLFLFKGLASYLIGEIEKRVDVVVSFKREASEEDILKVKEKLYSFSQDIENIDYISKDRALELFKEKHVNDPVYQQALNELQDNPLLASLNVKANNLKSYADITGFLEKNEDFASLINKISYNDTTHKQAIEKLILITNGVKQAGITIGVILSLLVILITFNTVKLSILSFKDEITTMKLVGASSRFVRGPFVIQIFICGIFSVAIADLIIFCGSFYLNNKISTWLSQFNILNYFQGNLLFLVAIQISIVIILGFISTWLASRKYLKI
ncbi:MAG: permease-like cell division protein FtsX [Candidatus Gribaldobacteria bacterium]|nr:permease-like cell division protein FtsX [Candidatus Gribaldobacteria bacterium]